MQKRILSKDVFLVETKIPDVWLVYAPLEMALFAVNNAGAQAFRVLQKGHASQKNNPLLDTLESVGLLGEGRLKQQTPPLATTPHAEITICPTFRCSLRCLYCFANGGERLDDLPLEAALRVVDLAIDRGQDGGAKHSRLTWHGGGEPTLAWDLLIKVSDYYRIECEKVGLEPSLSIVSNGWWSPRKLDWIATNVNRITISCDGPPDIQDKQRPLTCGLPSSKIVYKTLQVLREREINFGIRATITELNVRRMPEMVQFFHNLCQPKTLQFEGLAVCGRCESSGIRPGSAEDHIKYFCEAFDLAENLGINLGCSGVRIFRKSSRYCGAVGRTLCVTPEGLLTTCHRVDSLSHPLALEFIYGCWMGNHFSWQQEKLDALSCLTVDNLSWCENCFCKYTCAGGCAAARFSDTGSLFGRYPKDRCKTVRELTRHRLVSVAKKRGLFDDL